MFSSGVFVSKENKERLYALLPFFAFFTVLFILISRNPFFWDKDILFSKIAFWLTENHFNPVLPDTIDPGYPPLSGYLLAIGWNIFGKSLFLSHAIIFPFTLGIIWQIHILLSAYFPKNAIGASMLIILADTTFLGQTTLFSTDIFMLFFFLLAINAVVRNKRKTLVLAIFGLLFSHMRGLPMAAVVFIFDIYKHNPSKRAGTSILKLSVDYIPGILLLSVWFLFHYITKGWIGYHQNSPWKESFEIVNFKGLLRNILILFWRMLDYGKVFLWAAGMYFLLRIIKKQMTLDHAFKDLFFLLILTILASVPTMLLYKMLNGHRYLIAVNLFLSVAIACLIFTRLKKKKLKNVFTVVILAGLISGNFWVYPDKIAKGWDSSLAYLPYHHLRKQMIRFIEKKEIPFAQVGTESPNTAVFKFIDASDDERSFKRAALGRDHYVFYSNIFNMFSDDEIDTLKKDWLLEKEYRCMQVSVTLYRNPLWAKSPPN